MTDQDSEERAAGAEEEILAPEQILDRFEGPWYPAVYCGSGWFPLIERIDAYIVASYPSYRIEQIKEKYGGLRYYWEPDSDAGIANKSEKEISKLAAVRDGVVRIESEAMDICEICGQPGENDSTNGWYATRCPEHR